MGKERRARGTANVTFAKRSKMGFCPRASRPRRDWVRARKNSADRFSHAAAYNSSILSALTLSKRRDFASRDRSIIRNERKTRLARSAARFVYFTLRDHTRGFSRRVTRRDKKKKKEEEEDDGWWRTFSKN